VVACALIFVGFLVLIWVGITARTEGTYGITRSAAGRPAASQLERYAHTPLRSPVA
jgi:hypothetical protein